jgi:hypothetical protein
MKEDAVQQLPPGVAPSIRAQLRADVERALRRHGAEDSANEVEDIVATLVEDARRRLDRAGEQALEAERKPALMTLARLILGVVVQARPTHVVGASGSQKQAHTIQLLWAGLRPALEKALSGGESESHVREVVEGYVATWEGEQTRSTLRFPSPEEALRLVHSTKKYIDTAGQVPEIRQLVDIVWTAVVARRRHRGATNDPPPTPS